MASKERDLTDSIFPVAAAAAAAVFFLLLLLYKRGCFLH